MQAILAVLTRRTNVPGDAPVQAHLCTHLRRVQLVPASSEMQFSSSRVTNNVSSKSEAATAIQLPTSHAQKLGGYRSS